MTDKNIDLATHHDVLPEPRCYKSSTEHAVIPCVFGSNGLCQNHGQPIERHKKAEQTNDIAELEHENRLLRARNERLQALVNSIVPHLQSWCGANAMPPKRMAEHIEQWGNV